MHAIIPEMHGLSRRDSGVGDLVKMQGSFTTGTDTGVGKTWAGECLVQALVARGIIVAPRKPVESGWPADEREADAFRLGHAAGLSAGMLQQVCRHRLQAPLSPVRAAQMEGRILTTAQLHADCLQGVARQDFLYVEGAGGFYSPLACDGLNADLAQRLGLPVLLVAEDRLGCINQVLLTLQAIRSRGLQTLAIVLNRQTDHAGAAMNNAEDLRGYTNVPVFSMGPGQQTLPDQLIELAISRDRSSSSLLKPAT